MEKRKIIIALALIVIIAIVIVLVYAVGYRSSGAPASSVSTSVQPTPKNISTGLTNIGGTVLAPGCTGSTLFNCTNATITTSGELSLGLNSRSNSTLYDIHAACIAYNSTTDRPANASSWYAIDSLGTTKQANFTGTSMQPDGTENIANLQCYTASGNPASLGEGQDYQGLLLINYTSNSNPVDSSTVWTTAGAVAVDLNATQAV